jgi:hypothetical protein
MNQRKEGLGSRRQVALVGRVLNHSLADFLCW